MPVGVLDISFYRDDIGLKAEAPEVHETRIAFDINGRTLVLVDDVLVHGPHDQGRDGCPHGPRQTHADPAGRPG